MWKSKMNTKYAVIGTIIVTAVTVLVFVAPQTSSPIIMVPSTGWVSETEREYKNLLFHFSLIYPKDLQVREYDDGTSASTITFEDRAGKNGFQIFIVPYPEKQVSVEQFKKDVPSGVMENPINIKIDGAPATLFYSRDVIVGDTLEVWFIKNGFLYEVTTSKELESWLADIMKTWQFF